MNKINYIIRFFIFVICIIFYTPNVYAGNLTITEIMYDLDGSDIDWVEIYNSSSNDIDITTLGLFISNSTSNHGIIKYEGSQVIKPDKYGVIVPTSQISSFITKWGSSLNIFTSSFSLPNSTAKIEINNGDKNAPISSVTYSSSQGATNDGKSLQLNNSNSWVSGNPSPGAGFSQNTSLENNNTQNQNTSLTPTTVSSSPEITKVYKEPVMQFVFDVPINVIVGNNTTMKTKLLGYSGETINNGLFVWNFGDGQTINLNTNTNVEHAYLFPGTYTISCSYFYGSWYGKPVVVGRTKIEVIESPLEIKDIYREPYPALRISNNSDNEYDISNYIIQTKNTNITIPVGTYIGEDDDIVIVLPNQTELDGEIKLLSPLGYTSTIFNKTNTNKTVLSLNNNINDTTNNVLKNNQNINLFETDFSNTEIFDNKNNTDKIINLDNNLEENSKNNKSIYLQLFFIIAFSIGLLVFLRLYIKKENKNNSDDYALQDE